MHERVKRQSHKIVKHTQTIYRLLPTNCFSACDHFVGLALKGLTFIVRLSLVFIYKQRRKTKKKAEIGQKLSKLLNNHPLSQKKRTILNIHFNFNTFNNCQFHIFHKKKLH